jgi:hypothetical protein
MLVQKITRLSVTGSNAEICEMAPNVWMVVYHDIDTNLKGSMYVGMYVAQSEAEAEAEAKRWLEARELENEEYDV